MTITHRTDIPTTRTIRIIQATRPMAVTHTARTIAMGRGMDRLMIRRTRRRLDTRIPKQAFSRQRALWMQTDSGTSLARRRHRWCARLRPGRRRALSQAVRRTLTLLP
jgi:hypothetical protein